MTRYKVVLLWVVCLSFEVVMTGCEVVWVYRNVTDSFRVGEDGCTSNDSVCTSSASCQSDGSCLCHKGSPSFRNPIIKSSNGKLNYGSTYGCIDNFYALVGIETTLCRFQPFQIVPYSHTEPVMAFSQDSRLGQLLSCPVTRILIKFPHNATEMELQWLNESYVDISVSNNELFFKWKRSVPSLQGTIITIHLHCTVGPDSYMNKCLRAKILGTWPAETTSVPTESTASSIKIKSSPMTLTSTSSVKIRTAAIQLKSTVRAGSDDKSCSDSTSKIFIVLFSICIVVIIVLGVIVVYLWKDRQRIRSKNSQVQGMQNIEGNETGNTATTVVYVEVLDSGIHNDGVNEEESWPSSAEKNNNEPLSDPNYEEPSNYEPLRRNPLQDENEDHHYQSLTTAQKEYNHQTPVANVGSE